MIDAMKQALEVLEATINIPSYDGHPRQEAAAGALRAAIEQAEKAQRQPLTDTEHEDLMRGRNTLGYGRAVERAHGIGGGDE